MKALALLFTVALLHPAQAQETPVVAAPSGRFMITQRYEIDCKETIHFRDHPPVPLAALPWPAIYILSPDEQWLLRIQKTGSGESAALLYRIEENGRVTEVIGFNKQLWATAFTFAVRNDLFHTGIQDSRWHPDGRLLEITLSASSSSKKGERMKATLLYDLRQNRITLSTL